MHHCLRSISKLLNSNISYWKYVNAPCFPPPIQCSILSTPIKTSHDVSQVCGRAQVLLKYVLLNIGQHHICQWRFCSFLFLPAYWKECPRFSNVWSKSFIIFQQILDFSYFLCASIAEAPLTILERADLNLGRK